MQRHLSVAKADLDGFAQHLADEDVHLLDARGHVGWHDQQRIGKAVKLSTAFARKCRRDQPALTCRAKGL